MAYNEKIKNNNLKYFKDKQKRVSLNWLKEDFEGRIEPEIRKTGKPISTYIKEAVEEKIARDRKVAELPE